MRVADSEILIVPGWSGSGPDHWQARWARSLSTARIVVQDDWFIPERSAWTARLVEAVERAARPVVFVAHSLGVATVVHAAATLSPDRVAGAFLVAPADVDNAALWPVTAGHTFGASSAFAPLPTTRLPFPAVLVASADDPYCSFVRAGALATHWGASLVSAGPLGHINVASGQGPWPEGLMHLGVFMKGLG
ncbi:MAG: alpha/beta hydrolase [Hyphomicrobiaceae bacterium]|nr:alpha/beta hydrolase [Hyphomicrobiaceae bacterium]